jgi:hypothetical protein
MAARFFRKIDHGANKFFAKVREDAPVIGRKISVGLRQFGNTMNSIANNPITQAAAMASGNPEAIGMMQQAGSIGKQAGALTNAKNYSGNVNQVSQNILERAQAINQTANPNPINYH